MKIVASVAVVVVVLTTAVALASYLAISFLTLD
jgi:hypothetical protein